MCKCEREIEVKIKLLDGGKMPEYKTDEAACMDCYCNNAEKITMPPFTNSIVGLGFALEIPKGYQVVIEPRSSSIPKYKNLVIHGEIDSDYRGELKVNLFNLNPKEDIIINRGDRLCQIKLLPVYRLKFTQADELSQTERGTGGFGSTDEVRS